MSATVSHANQAVVLCAGRGARMGPLTADVPKILLPVAGTPLIERIVAMLSTAGFGRAVLVGGYRHELVAEALAASADAHPGLDVELIIDPSPSGTLHSMRCAQDVLGVEPFVYLEGAVLTSSDFLTRLRGQGLPDGGAVVGSTARADAAPSHHWVVHDSGYQVRQMIPPHGEARVEQGLHVGRSMGIAQFDARIFESTCKHVGEALRDHLESGRTLHVEWEAEAYHHFALPEDFDWAPEPWTV